MSHFERHGMVSATVRVNALHDALVIYGRGTYALTKASFAIAEWHPKLTKSVRRNLGSITRKEIEPKIANIVKANVLRHSWGLYVRPGEQVEVDTFARDFDFSYSAVTAG